MNGVLRADTAWRVVSHLIPLPPRDLYREGKFVPSDPLGVCRTPLPAVVCTCGLWLIDEYQGPAGR